MTEPLVTDEEMEMLADIHRNCSGCPIERLAAAHSLLMGALEAIDSDNEGREYSAAGRDQHQDIARHALASLRGEQL